MNELTTAVKEIFSLLRGLNRSFFNLIDILIRKGILDESDIRYIKDNGNEEKDK